MVGGKAKLLCEDSCDGSGNCLASCPQKALHFSIVDVDKSFKFKKASSFLNWPFSFFTSNIIV